MVFNKILLIRPVYKKSHFSRGSALPIGLGYLAETLDNNNIDYGIMDMTLGYSFKDLSRKIKQFLPDLICVTMMTYMYKYNYEFIEKIKKNFPYVKIAVGGVHMSTLKEKVMEECKAIDFGVVLEGEHVLVELCRGNNLENIKGLIYRKNNKVIFNGKRDPIMDLDLISFPTYKKFEIEKYPKNINIISSRGCPYQCVYCSVKHVTSNIFRARSPKNIIEEIKYWYYKGYRSFSFMDDNFTLVRERVEDLCNEIKKSDMKDLIFDFPGGVRADKVDYKLLKLMKEIGSKSIAFGVESGNDLVLKNLKKGSTIRQMEQAIKAAVELGYNVHLFFLIGSPGETIEEVKESIDLALKYDIKAATFYNLFPFPGSELYDWIEQNNFFIKEYSQYMNEEEGQWTNNPVYVTKEFPLKDRKEAYKLTRKAMKEIEKRNYKGSKIVKNLLFFQPVYGIRNNKNILDFLYFAYTSLPQSQKNLIKIIVGKMRNKLKL